MLLAEWISNSRKQKVFSSDARGETAVTFALTLLPLLLIVGAAVDYSRAVAQRSNLQQATDAAVLALAHNSVTASSTSASLKAPAQTYLAALSTKATLTNLTLDPTTSQVCLKTAASVSTSLMALAGVKALPVSAYACAVPNTSMTYEVALALDNSGSMAEQAGGASKIAALQTAAQKLIDILIPAGTQKPTTAVALVPFTALVNVGSDATASFLDKQGASSIHWQNFKRPAATYLAPFYPTSKLDLFSTMNTKWSGCVEERPSPLITKDVAASTGNPDSLFVPFLSPDDPGDTTNACFFLNPATQAVQTAASCTNLGSGPLNTHYFLNSYIADTGSASTNQACLLNPNAATLDLLQTNVSPGSGMTMVCKYRSAKPVIATGSSGLTTGPNALCTSQQLTPLTTDRSVLSSALSAMQANGSTNLATGFMWAWRALSPIVAAFPVSNATAIGRQNPKPYSSASNALPTANKKIIILMTDGENNWISNTASPWLSTYEAFGYYKNNRIASYGDCTGTGTIPTTASNYRCQMDSVSLEACTNAKAAGVVIYTIGFSVSGDPIDAQGLSLLQSCASSAGMFFQASDGASIANVFQQIATQIQSLRLTQ